MWDPNLSLKQHLDFILEECFLANKGSRRNTARTLKIAIRTVGNYLHRNPRLKAIYADEKFIKSMRTVRAHEWAKMVNLSLEGDEE